MPQSKVKRITIYNGKEGWDTSVKIKDKPDRYRIFKSSIELAEFITEITGEKVKEDRNAL